MVAAIHQKCVIPGIDDAFFGDAFDVGKIHHHALIGSAFGGHHLAGQGDFNGVTVAVQVTVVIPTGKEEPEAGAQTTEAAPQLSVAVGVA